MSTQAVPSGIVRVGVIGAGVMGSDHARTIAARISGAHLSAVADIDISRTQTLAAELNTKSYGDPYELINADNVDAVLVASHDSTHAALILACIAASKPVLCEKPLALDLDECTQVITAEREAGQRFVSVGFSRRFDPALVELKTSLGAGSIGRPLIAHAVHRNVSNDSQGDSISTILGSAIHELDQTPWLFSSPIIEVMWHQPASTTLLPQRQDPQLILIRTANGVLTTVEVFVNAVYGYEVRLEVVGETGTLSLGTPAPLVQRTARTLRTEYPSDWRPRYATAYRDEVQTWINAIIRDSYDDLALADSSDGYRATAAAHAVIAAMADEGRGFAPKEMPL